MQATPKPTQNPDQNLRIFVRREVLEYKEHRQRKRGDHKDPGDDRCPWRWRVSHQTLNQPRNPHYSILKLQYTKQSIIASNKADKQAEIKEKTALLTEKNNLAMESSIKNTNTLYWHEINQSGSKFEGEKQGIEQERQWIDWFGSFEEMGDRIRIKLMEEKSARARVWSLLGLSETERKRTKTETSTRKFFSSISCGFEIGFWQRGGPGKWIDHGRWIRIERFDVSVVHESQNQLTCFNFNNDRIIARAWKYIQDKIICCNL